MAADANEPIDRWTSERRVALVETEDRGFSPWTTGRHPTRESHSVECVSERRSCQALGVNRADLHRTDLRQAPEGG
jgi:hypothetical protein